MGIFFFLKTRSLQVLDESDNGRRDDLIVITSEAAGLIQTQLFVVVHTHVCLEQSLKHVPRPSVRIIRKHDPLPLKSLRIDHTKIEHA